MPARPVAADQPRGSLATERLRDPFGEASSDELAEILDAVGELLNADVRPP